MSEAIIQLKAKLQNASSVDDDVFRQVLIESRKLLKIDALKISEGLGVPRSTVARWFEGQAIPHTLIRHTVYEVLQEFCEERLLAGVEK